LWVQVASDTDIEEMARLPLRIEGLADSLSVAESTLPDNVSVRIRGSRLQLLLADLVQRELGRVTLDMNGLGPGRHRYDVSVLDVRVNATPVEVVPAVALDIVVERRVRKMVPVRMRTEGELPDGYTRVGREEISPARVEVTGPESEIQSVEEIATLPVRLGRRRASFQEQVALVVPDPDLAVRPVEVEIAVGIDELIERDFTEVPVTILSGLDGEWTTVEPTSARVRVRGAASVVRALRAEEVSVVVPIDDGIRGVAQVAAQVAVPDGVLGFTVEPATFQVIVDDGTAGAVTEEGR
jgi:YbbR domain-containing protein